MDVKPSAEDTFVAVDPDWDEEEGVLWVNAEMEGDLGGWDKITYCLTCCRVFKKWSLTRWGRSGKSGRLFMRGQLTGIAKQVEILLSEESVDNTNLSGFRKVNEQILLLLGAAALGVRPFEVFLIQLLIDDAFLKRFTELVELVKREMDAVADLPDLVWARLSKAIGVTKEHFQHCTLYVMVTTFGFWWRETCMEVLELPLRLTQGDVAQNLTDLDNRPESATEPFSKRLLEYFTLNGIEGATRMLTILKNSSMTTALAEEGHAPGAILMRGGSGFTEKGLRVRAFLSSARTLVRGKKVSMEIKRILTRVRNLKKKQPGKFTARQKFFKLTADHTVQGLGVGADRRAATETCMAKHALDFRKLSFGMRDRLMRSARRDVNEKKRNATSELRELEQHKRRLEREEREAAAQRGCKQNHLLQGRLSDEELQKAVDFFNSPACQSAQLEQNIGAWGEVPAAPPDSVVEELLDHAAPMMDEEAAVVPWWAKIQANLRDDFDSVACALEPDADDWYLFLYGKQKPHQIMLLRLRRRPLEVRLDQVEHIRWNERIYDYFPLEAYSETTIGWPTHDDFDLWVKADCRMQGRCVITPHEPQLLEVWLRGRPTTGSQRAGTRTPGPRRPRRDRDADARLREEFPELSSSDFEAEGHRRRRPRRARGPRLGPRPPAPAGHAAGGAAVYHGPEGGEDIDELLDFHEASDDDEGDLDMYFYVRHTKGKPSRGQDPRVDISIGGFARAEVQTWCLVYEFPVQRDFNIRLYEGEGNCTMLAREYCRRATYFYRIWRDAEDREVEYTDRHVTEYRPTAAWEQFCRDCYHIETLDRVMELNGLAPKLGRFW